MILSVIVAIGKSRQIGLGNKLLWHLSADLKRFKSLTRGHHILMGRKTYESIGRPLPHRINIIITRDQSFSASGCEVVHSVEEAIELAKKNGENELFFCGGEAIYSQGLEICDKLYLTEVDFDGVADTFLPDYGQYKWKEDTTESFLSDEKNQYSFITRNLIKLK
ncbi:MAG: dihydrofolate reductase [Bacteriovoracaceae bacterium]|nr:dihydrofolate reductase [Bacteriovoracaceae bacterium]